MYNSSDPNATIEAASFLQDLLNKAFKEGFEEGRIIGISEGIEMSIETSTNALQDLIASNDAKGSSYLNINTETKIKDSGLFPAAIRNGLMYYGLETIGDIEKQTIQNLEKARNLGEKRIKEIARTMVRIGHPLATE